MTGAAMTSNRTHTAFRWKPITPSDTARIEPIPAAIRANVEGDIVAVGDDGVSGTFTVAAGQVLEIQPHRILATGTTAEGINALYN